MWNLGGPLTRTPDRMSCSPPDSTPPPPHSSESVVEFNPPLRVGGSRGKTEPSHFSVFKDLQLKSRKPPAAKELSHSFSEAARKAGIQIALRLQEITYSVFPHLGSYSVTWNVAQKKKKKRFRMVYIPRFVSIFCLPTGSILLIVLTCTELQEGLY